MPATKMQTPNNAVVPVANTTPGQWQFVSGGVSRLTINNFSGQNIFVRFNDANNASASVYDILIPNNTCQLVRALFDLGLDVIDNVSVWFPTSATVANFNISGN